jgi:hypothetical protein
MTGQEFEALIDDEWETWVERQAEEWEWQERCRENESND